MNKNRGFTLLELITALTVFALMSLAIFALLRMGITAWNRSTDRMSEQLRYRSVSESMEKQIACFSPVLVPLDSGLIRGQKVPFFRGWSDRIEFVSLSALKFQESPGLTIVSYYIKDVYGKRYLVENERRYLGVDSLNQLVSNPENEIPLFEIENAEFRYYEKPEEGSTGIWVDSWDSTLKWLLPSAVELKVTFGKNGMRLARTNRFVIPVMARPLFQPNLRQMQPRTPSNIPGTPIQPTRPTNVPGRAPNRTRN